MSYWITNSLLNFKDEIWTYFVITLLTLEQQFENSGKIIFL